MSTSGVRYSARELARLLELPPPSDEQVLVIEAPLSPVLVVAGAGSGKTATMANRVSFLVANGLVLPEEILGLTFTRKAAGELAERIAGHLERLRMRGLLPERERAESGSGEPLHDPASELFVTPMVSTYNSFANSIFREGALLVGRDSESVLLGANAAWGIARSIVVKNGDARLAQLGKSLDQLTQAVLDLSHALSENLVEGAAVVQFTEEFVALRELPRGENTRKRTDYASVLESVAAVGALPLLIELVDLFNREKLRRGLVEFSDQVALALAVVQKSAIIRTEYRSRFRVVLLDEYQDTSVVQTRLLSELFADHPVMAVGDPHQSIYGWRGASAENLAAFSRDFVHTSPAPAGHFMLSISWRNGAEILAAANTTVGPLTARSVVAVPTLAPRPGAPTSRIDTMYSQTQAEEASDVAEWLSKELSAPGAETASAAILFRARKSMAMFAEELAMRNIPHHILGVGGLLSVPEVVDVVSALRVSYDPGAGSALIRLLAGPKWRIGVRDLRALSGVARWLSHTDSRRQVIDPALAEALAQSVDPDDQVSIIDALDFVAEARSGNLLSDFSEEGLLRLRDAGQFFAQLRARTGLPLPDFVRFVEQQLLLDIELEVHKNSSNTGSALVALDALHDELASFMAVDEDGSLGSFLRWVDRAEKNDDMSPRSEEPEPGTVQLLTIHGSKGLEWDYVAIPRFVNDELPAKPKSTKAWLTFAALPYEFRGDVHSLPRLAWRGVASQQEFDERFSEFTAEVAQQAAEEERRLAYVAITRARTNLLLSGSFWATQQKPRHPSPYLRELEAAGLIAALPLEPEDDTNPLDSASQTLLWPTDPLGAKRGGIEGAAALVDELASESATTGFGRWHREIDLLLAERAERSRPSAGTIPVRIAASRFKDFVSDPAGAAAQLLRPVPERPFRQARLGTRFHTWVEHRNGITGASEMIDFDGDLDDDQVTDEEQFAALKATFEQSPWAHRRAIDVEREIHLPLANRIVVCKIDAVFDEGDGRYLVVDWKTGRAPTNAAELELKQHQLALYRLAYATWKGVDPERVDALFYFVSEDKEVRPARLYSAEELRALMAELPA